jgi:hypothetical protein
MTSLRLNLGLVASLAAAACLGAPAAHATPIITTFTQYSVGPVTDTDGPQVGGALSSSVATTDGASLCGITGSCPPGANTNANAFASQRETALGIFSALTADATYYDGGPSAHLMTSRTTWQESPPATGPTSITLFIKPGELVLSDFAGLSLADPVPIELRFKIELTVNGTRFFFSEAILRGGRSGHSLTENGTDLGGTFFADVNFPNNVAGYRFDPLFTTIDLGNLLATDVVLYSMEVSVSGPGFETGGFARVGDPFDLSGGGSSIAFSVPEPSVALMLGIVGALALAFWREREKQRSKRR